MRFSGILIWKVSGCGTLSLAMLPSAKQTSAMLTSATQTSAGLASAMQSSVAPSSKGQIFAGHTSKGQIFARQIFARQIFARQIFARQTSTGLYCKELNITRKRYKRRTRRTSRGNLSPESQRNGLKNLTLVMRNGS